MLLASPQTQKLSNQIWSINNTNDFDFELEDEDALLDNEEFVVDTAAVKGFIILNLIYSFYYDWFVILTLKRASLHYWEKSW